MNDQNKKINKAINSAIRYLRLAKKNNKGSNVKFYPIGRKQALRTAKVHFDLALYLVFN